ncbi:class I SAM-dependent methyltransferase [Aquimarina sp. 2201CG14-23]|uniref:class I SAM-dependent methyltransferase n=1 Tax=Aquimarina mycalae TaxID=3040073 RepID=UPI002478088E|nr:class I SAM-dependent methyltransferase [Aquimarina sp. 2201CG14-23]MDH7445556.1 class I SAM-dependent methyltransferase [Aquimarina sp. 2201CG14-23]
MVLYNKFLIILIFIGIGTSYGQYTENDWEDRDTWMKVSEIFKIAEINPGNIVADIGCHEGYLSIHMSNTVGKLGKVYAVDVREDRLDKLNDHIKKRKLKNIKTILGDYDNPKLPDNSLDIVVILDTYHEMEDYKKILYHVKKSLKMNGSIVLIEKFKSHMKNESRAKQVDAHTLAMHYVKDELIEAGFSIKTEIKDFGRWKNEEDKRIWVLVGKKK